MFFPTHTGLKFCDPKDIMNNLSERAVGWQQDWLGIAPGSTNLPSQATLLQLHLLLLGLSLDVEAMERPPGSSCQMKHRQHLPAPRAGWALHGSNLWGMNTLQNSGCTLAEPDLLIKL